MSRIKQIEEKLLGNGKRVTVPEVYLDRVEKAFYLMCAAAFCWVSYTLIREAFGGVAVSVHATKFNFLTLSIYTVYIRSRRFQGTGSAHRPGEYFIVLWFILALAILVLYDLGMAVKIPAELMNNFENVAIVFGGNEVVKRGGAWLVGVKDRLPEAAEPGKTGEPANPAKKEI